MAQFTKVCNTLKYHCKVSLINMFPKQLNSVAKYIVFAWFFTSGIMHFSSIESYFSVMPSYLFYPYWVIYLVGTFQIISSVGLLFRPQRKKAGYCLLALTIIMNIANIRVLQNAEVLTHFMDWGFFAQLLIQIVLCLLIWFGIKHDNPYRFSSMKPY
jgi:uncharacterized membrane protein